MGIFGKKKKEITFKCNYSTKCGKCKEIIYKYETARD